LLREGQRDGLTVRGGVGVIEGGRSGVWGNGGGVVFNKLNARLDVVASGINDAVGISDQGVVVGDSDGLIFVDA